MMSALIGNLIGLMLMDKLARSKQGNGRVRSSGMLQTRCEKTDRCSRLN